MAGVLGQVQHGRFPLDRLVVRDGKPMKGKCGKRPETQESYCPKGSKGVSESWVCVVFFSLFHLW